MKFLIVIQNLATPEPHRLGYKCKSDHQILGQARIQSLRSVRGRSRRGTAKHLVADIVEDLNVLEVLILRLVPVLAHTLVLE